MFLAICQERSNGDTISAIAFKGKQCRDWFWSGTGDNNTILSEYRIFTIQDTSMTISYAVLRMSSGWSATERTDRMIPYRIYGIM